MKAWTICIFLSCSSILYAQSFIHYIHIYPTGGVTIYDFPSNGSPKNIIQDPGNRQSLHATLISSPSGDPTFIERRTLYFYSSNGGVNWSNQGAVPDSSVRTGFPSISLTYDGNAIIANHGVFPGYTGTPSFVHISNFPGIGAWTSYNVNCNNTVSYIWSAVTGISGLNDSTRFIVASKANGFQDGNIIKGKTFGSNICNPFDYAAPQGYQIAEGVSGRVGIAFISEEPASYGDVFFIESNDNGSNFSAPLKIFDAKFSGSGADSLSGFRGIDIVYKQNIPFVVFETVKRTESGSMIRNLPSNIRIWSSSYQGADPNKSKIVIDSTRIPFHPYKGFDPFTAICRPVIGTNYEGNMLYVAFMSTSGQLQMGVDTTSFMNIVLIASNSNGNIWAGPNRINPVLPRKDWTFPSISSKNEDTTTYLGNRINLTALSDSVAGTTVNGSSAGNGAQQYFIKVAAGMITSITPLSTATSYSLSQNYPNPFNNETKIKFSLLKSGLTTLKVYNLAGKLVKELINNDYINNGEYEVRFNADNLSSGVYFYVLKSDEFKSIKKMVLLK